MTNTSASSSASSAESNLRTPGSSGPSGSTIAQRRHSVVREIAQRELMSDGSPVCGVLDLDTLDEHLHSLESAYTSSASVLHTIAAKANGLGPLLAHIAAAGYGCEAASPGELTLALHAGFPPDMIVFDSPAKTASDLRRALELGIRFNIDSFEELARVDSLMAARPGPLPQIGIRINPQTGAGKIGPMSTATSTSKFGVGLADDRAALVEAIASRPWLTQLHVHSGSQGLTLDHAADGIRKTVELAEAVEARVGRQQITSLDIGGGLPVNFSSDEVRPTFADHRAAIEAAVPRLFDGRYALITEFGRALTAKSGTLISRVEYVKQTGHRRIAVTHAGVQVAPRTVFMPESWPLRIEVYDSEGGLRTGPQTVQDIAGPACFAGDMLAEGRTMPRVHAGDLVAVPDTGGYYFSGHYSYNALARPAVYAVGTDASGTRQWGLVRAAQTAEQLWEESGGEHLTAMPGAR